MKRAKYGNHKQNGFDSKAEEKRFGDLVLLQRVGSICNLERQVRYDLLPSVMYPRAKRSTGPCWYTADFRYEEVAGGRIVIEDVKGFADPVFKLKRHMMKALLDLDITIPGERPYGAGKVAA